MPNVYETGARIDELQARVNGGVTVVLHDEKEVSLLRNVLKLAARPPEDPLQSAARAIGDPALSWEAWREYLYAEGISDTQERTSSIPDSRFHQLLAALEVASELWREAVDPQKLVLGVVLAHRRNDKSEEIRIDGTGAGLAFHPGSILAQVTGMTMRGVGWVVCLAVGGGTTPAARAPRTVADLRERALTEPNAKRLPSLLEIPAVPNPAQPLVVLVHGLFATDVGTFGALQEYLQRQHGANVVGFPHETISTRIAENGRHLAQRLASLPGLRKVVFFAHSRGGLVARSAAVQLRRDPATANLVHTCVTFGTPHEGAALAENPGALMAALVLLRAVRLGSEFLVDAVCYLSQEDGCCGITDLRPSRGKGTWLEELQAEEGMFPDLQVPIYAYGGATSATSLRGRIVEALSARIIGNEQSDLIVSLASSQPRLGNPQSVVQPAWRCDHFGYFGSGEWDANTFGSLDRAIFAPPTIPPGLAGGALAPKPIKLRRT